MVVCSSTTNYNNPNNNDEENLVYGHRLSSVGPALVTGELSYEPNNMDLAMKLHYLRVVYFLEKQAIEGLIPIPLKEGIFAWFCYYYETVGRFRRSEEDGKPYIKCNDCGARFVEAKSSKTLEEWIQMEETCSQRLLVADNVLGPELTFSPPLFIQITSLKCGGLALGLSWAHVLGDAFSVAEFMNTLAHILNGNKPNYPPNYEKSPPHNLKPINSKTSEPKSLKQVGPVGDHWFIPSPAEMDTFTFHVSPKQLAQLQAKLIRNYSTPSPIQPFELLSSVIWQAIAKIRNGSEPNTVTIIKKDAESPKKDDTTVKNNQVVGSIKVGFSVADAHPEKLAALIHDMIEDERAQIEEVVGRDPGGSDYIVYGSNLTFVNWEEAEFYGFELKGLRPRLVNCFVDGIGEEGVVLVLPSAKDKSEGRAVTLILPKTYMLELKQELKQWDLIA